MVLTFLQLSCIFVNKVSGRLWRRPRFCICGCFLHKQTDVTEEQNSQQVIEFIHWSNSYLDLDSHQSLNNENIQSNICFGNSAGKNLFQFWISWIVHCYPPDQVCKSKNSLQNSWSTWVKCRSFITSSMIPLHCRARKKSASDRDRCVGPWSFLTVSASTSRIFPWISIW